MTPDGDPDQIAEAEQAESLSRVERGGIPLAAERRLRALRERGGSFTSDLSVADFALCHQLGLRPLSQVMGSSIYQVGWQEAPWSWGAGGSFMFELETLSEAWNGVRRRALQRLAEEAAHVGADAVVDLALRTGSHAWAENSIEYVAIGTAVAHGGRPGPAREPKDTGGSRESRPTAANPVLTELSMADLAKLERAGIEPLGIVAWSSVFFAAASPETQMMGGLSGRMMFPENQELGEYTQGFYEARETVMRSLTSQAAELNANGVVGMRINHGVERISIGGGRYQRGGLMVTFHAIGTAIREREALPLHPPETTIDLTL
ncbi:MAG TPA: heavy metal-binding domain-containing protein [Solirubrobacteraceae bacterium]|jgi:uncharacterized protein YbjQ (UPF0145 family)